MAKKPQTVKKKKQFSHREFIVYILAFAVIGVFTLWVSFAAPVKRDSGCIISPSSVVLDQVWTVSAWGLPVKSTVNQKIIFPDGGESTGPIKVAVDGTYTTTGNSNMSKDWGFIAPEQLGVYTYKFVNKVKWPSGAFTTTYATCTVIVN